VPQALGETHNEEDFHGSPGERDVFRMVLDHDIHDGAVMVDSRGQVNKRLLCGRRPFSRLVVTPSVGNSGEHFGGAAEL